MRTYISIILLLLCACNGVSGDCNPPRFSPEFVTFEKGATTKILKSSNNVVWSFDRIKIDGQNVDMPYDVRSTEITGTWFKLKKIDGRNVEVSVTDTSVAKTLSFEFFAGNCSQTITVKNIP